MATKIRVLDDITINKIAAGEVIENPSSVVKELIENALDAHASDITIEIQAGGRLLIRISDNGTGMCKDDALLSIERHATSKLASIDDLQTIASMGFRGEALPSIASVSKFSILTSDGEESTLLKVEGGRIIACDLANPATRAKGTTIEVKDLFFNVPVRKKFLKSPSFDENEIIRTTVSQALAHPAVKFQLIINQKPYLLTQTAKKMNFLDQLQERIEQTLGAEWRDVSLPLFHVQEEGTVQGYIGDQTAHRHNRLSQYLFINGRPVSSAFVSYAVKEAYSTYLPTGRHPIFVLHLTLPPEEIDINVHPQKKEVRLRNETLIKKWLFLSVKTSLAQRNTPSLADWTSPTLPHLPWESSFPIIPEQEPVTTTPFPYEERTLPITTPKHLPQVLATLKGFIVTEPLKHKPYNEGICLIDQQRAHARILFEQLAASKTHEVEKEQLLLPLTLEMAKMDFLLLKEHLEELRSIGIEMREFGPHTFAIDAYPLIYSKESIPDLIQAYLSELKEFSHSSFRSKNPLIDKSLKLSISSEKRLSLLEAEKLVQDLFNCASPFESPIGKPTLVALDREHLARQFQK